MRNHSSQKEVYLDTSSVACVSGCRKPRDAYGGDMILQLMLLPKLTATYQLVGVSAASSVSFLVYFFLSFPSLHWHVICYRTYLRRGGSIDDHDRARPNDPLPHPPSCLVFCHHVFFVCVLFFFSSIWIVCTGRYAESDTPYHGRPEVSWENPLLHTTPGGTVRIVWYLYACSNGSYSSVQSGALFDTAESYPREGCWC